MGHLFSRQFKSSYCLIRLACGWMLLPDFKGNSFALLQKREPMQSCGVLSWLRGFRRCFDCSLVLAANTTIAYRF